MAMSREESHSDLERFFLELAPRLETARALDRRLARRFNVFDYLRTRRQAPCARIDFPL